MSQLAQNNECPHKVYEDSWHSIRAQKVLKRTQTLFHLPQNKLIQDEPTRWDLIHSMLERLIEQKSAVASCILNNLYSVLKLFREVTTIVNDHSTSASQFIPLVNSLRKAVQLDTSVCMTSVKKDILRELEK
ncbi:hypothetical protein PR048_001759 [Dryococelus australis]|uniref:Uncharacterized protein n=1 Tax=Dryococelus australis TaxID=614101 RepID=A0ABQ9II88_9NEOP|nr:hypothetical protein PR048_001759 [Dryococelus australis]